MFESWITETSVYTNSCYGDLSMIKTCLPFRKYYFFWGNHDFLLGTTGRHVILYELIDIWVLNSNTGGGSLIAPMALAHPLQPIDNRSTNRRRNLWVGWCFLLMTFVPVQKLCVYIYIYIYIHIYAFFIRVLLYDVYKRSVIQYWWSCTPSHSMGLYFWRVGEFAVPVLNATYCFLWFTNCLTLW